MKLKKESEKIGLLLAVEKNPLASLDAVRAAAVDVAHKMPYRTAVFVTPGGAFGNTALLFSSITNAAYFLLRHTKTHWTNTCRSYNAQEFQEVIRIRAMIQSRCNDDRYSDKWWFAHQTQDADGSNDHIDNMKDYEISDMRSYDYKKETYGYR